MSLYAGFKFINLTTNDSLELYFNSVLGPESVAVAPLILPRSNGLDSGPHAFYVEIWTLKSDVSSGGNV